MLAYVVSVVWNSIGYKWMTIFIIHELSSLALKLLSLSASAASMEQIFSNFGLIQTKLRNRLGLDKAYKLVMFYRCLRGKVDIRLVLCDSLTDNNKFVNMSNTYIY